MKFTTGQVSGLIDVIYASTMHEQKWATFVERFCDLVEGATISITSRLPEQDEILLAAFGQPIDWVGQFEKSFNGHQRVIAFLEGIPVGQVFNESDLPLVDRIQTFFAELSVSGMAGLVIAKGGGRRLTLKAIGPRSWTKTEQEDLNELLVILAPHLVRATNQFNILHVTRSVLSEFSRLMDSVLIPSVVTDANCHFQIANSAGDALLRSGQTLQIGEQNQVVLATPENTRRLRQKVTAAIVGQCSEGLSYATDDGVQSIRIVPFKPAKEISRDEHELFYEAQARVAIFVGQTRSFPLESAVLRDVFDLTPSEATICRLLLNMQTPAEIADTLNKSLRTVRNQIQSTYSKIGISRNAELADALALFKVIGNLE